MLQRIHRRLGTAGLAVAVIALIAALGGTALAASGALTGKQKKEVEKIAKKYAGVPGTPGAAGPAGPQGPAGKDGAAGGAGTPGAPGATGATGKTGTTGATGKTGTTGATGPAGSGNGGPFDYVFSSDTSGSDPGSGKLALNNAEPSQASALTLSTIDADSGSLAGVIPSWAVSNASVSAGLKVTDITNPALSHAYVILANPAATIGGSSPGSSVTLTIMDISGNAVQFADGDALEVEYYVSPVSEATLGSTQTGYWSFATAPGQTEAWANVSFPQRVPLSSVTQVHYVSGPNETDTVCGKGPGGAGGAANRPKAPLGTFCVWPLSTGAGFPENATFDNVYDQPGSLPSKNNTPGNVLLPGAFLRFTVNTPANPAYGAGTWAVTP